MPPRVLLYVPLGDCDQRKWMVMLWTHCASLSYKPEAVVHSWCDAFKLWTPNTHLVVARRDHAPWLEIVSDPPEAPPSSQQRTGRM